MRGWWDRWGVWVALVLVVALAFAGGCGGDDDASGSTAGRPGSGTDGGDGSGGTSGSRSSRDASTSGAGPDASSHDSGDAGQPTSNDGGTSSNPDAGHASDEDAGAAGAAGSNPSTTCADDCDDGIDCTLDECLNEVCTHAVNADVCDPGEACDVRGPGCTATSPCGNVDDCADSDPCTTRVRCNTALASCEWDILDGDGDGHPPQGCGGDDPDDANTNVRPGATDICDGEDNDGDGDADEEPEASASCISGSCPGCSIGCQRPSDIAQLHAPTNGGVFPGLILFDVVHAICPDPSPSIAQFCPTTDTDPDYFSSDCDSCLTALWMCGDPCDCSTNASDVPYCYDCLCDRGCVAAFEACSGIDHPATCN